MASPSPSKVKRESWHLFTVAPGYPDILGSSSQRRFVGTETFIEASWQANRHLNITTAYDHFFRGDFLNDIPGTSDSDYFAVWATVKFQLTATIRTLA